MTNEEKGYHLAAKIVEDAEQSQLFGKPCYKINKKAFCCFFQNEMVFKLHGEMHQQALHFKGAKLFDPSGKNRPMKEWVQIPFLELLIWEKFAIEAAKYVRAKK